MRIAYCRVSTANQNLQRQEEALEQYVEEQDNPDDEFYSFHEFQIAVN